MQAKPLSGRPPGLDGNKLAWFNHGDADETMMHPPKYKALEGARKTWRRRAGQKLLPKRIANVKFKDEIEASPPQAKAAA